MPTDFFSYPHSKQLGVHPNLTENLFKPDFPTERVKEGKVTVVVPNLAAYVTEPSEYAPSKAPVFYNPVMELNRDISVLALQAYQRMVNKKLGVCEPLASSGVRGVRYAAEIRGIKKVLVNDISTRAVQLAKQNVQLNNLDDNVSVSHKDANCLLGCHSAPQKRFDVVDLDPFGTPVRYMDAAVRALRDNGLWCLTATDLAPLCGVHARACLRKYGGRPLRTEYCHELAVRLLAGCAATVAAKHEIGIRVLFSHSTDHYIRVYATIKFGAKKADYSLRNMGYVLHCFNCLHRETTTAPFTIKIENCPECGSRMDYAGPLWLGKILDNQFCESVLSENRQHTFKNSAKITKLLSLAGDEADAPPTYFVVDKLSAKLGLPVPSVATMLNRLREKGFDAVPTHFNTRGIRTNAPAQKMQDLVKSFANNK
jgi:tRNA (guanine26-N2/guanine27-N2)-dimethyltransferase